MQQFIIPIRVYYEDTDAEGVVYHANYLHYLERARTEWCRELGFSVAELAEQNNILVVRKVEIKYLRAAKLDNLLEVVTGVAKVSKVKIEFVQQIRDFHDHKKMFCDSLVEVVCVNKNLKPCKLNTELLEKIKS